MGLCSPRSCGCAIVSESLIVSGSGEPGSPWSIEIADLDPGSVNVDTMELIMPAGTIRSTIAAVAETGWVLFGTSTPNADVLFPYLWPKLPSAWKVGTTMTLPTDADTVLRGSSGTLGAISGTNTKTIATANLPSHAHGIDHQHPNTESGVQTADHSHAASLPTSANGEHYHGSGPFPFVKVGLARLLLEGTPGDPGLGVYTDDPITTAAGNHAHVASGQTGGVSANHTHWTVNPAFTGTSGNTGSGTALNVQEQAINVRFMIKAH